MLNISNFHENPSISFISFSSKLSTHISRNLLSLSTNVPHLLTPLINSVSKPEVSLLLVTFSLGRQVFWETPEAVNLTWTNATRVFSTNYTVRVFTSGCLFFEEASSSWSSAGCRVLEADHRSTTCSCNHLTSFGSGFFVMPNTIDFDYVFANASENNTMEPSRFMSSE